MTTTDQAEGQIVRLPQASHMSQVTAVEQARAVAEVAAAIEVARRFPRDWVRAQREMERSCSNIKLAEQAFYRFPRGLTSAGKTNYISGPSVQLARTLARCFGNLQYGLIELRRDSIKGESEMQAWAWDVETNVRVSSTFVSPHQRDRSADKGGNIDLTDVREIYENNANMGARRLREQIFAVLPPWFTEDAIQLCHDTLNADIKDEDLDARRVTMAAKFKDLGVTEAQLQQKLGAPPHRWSKFDLSACGVIFRSIERGETTVEAEFGEPGQRAIAIPKAADQKPDGDQDQGDKPEPAGRTNVRADRAAREITDILVRYGLGGDDPAAHAARLAIVRRAAAGKGKPPLDIDDMAKLTDPQVMTAAANLKKAVADWQKADHDPAEQLAAMAAEGTGQK